MEVGDILVTALVAVVEVITGVVVVNVNRVLYGTSETDTEAKCGEVVIDTTVKGVTVIVVRETVTLVLEIEAEV